MMKSTPLAVAACLELLGTNACSWERVVARRANSKVHLVQCNARAIAIKECFYPGSSKPDPSAAEREFMALVRLSSAVASSISTIGPIAPIPLLLCREHAAYGMNWIPGYSATDEVLSASAGLQRAAVVGEAVGAWLRTLHSLRPLADRRNDFESRLETIRQHRAASGARDRLSQQAADALVSYASAAADISMPASWVHGDMKCDNLLIHGNSIVGLDLHLVHENTVVYDLAPFLNHLRLLRWTPSGVLQGRKLCITGRSFLQAYSPDTARWGLPIAWLRTYLLVQIAAPVERAGSLRGAVARWIARRELACAMRELRAAAEQRPELAQATHQPAAVR